MTRKWCHAEPSTESDESPEEGEGCDNEHDISNDGSDESQVESNDMLGTTMMT